MHRSERDDSMIDIVGGPGHSRDIFPPELLTCTPTDCVDCLRDEMVVERQSHVAHVKESIVSYVKRVRGVGGHSLSKRIFWNVERE